MEIIIETLYPRDYPNHLIGLYIPQKASDTLTWKKALRALVKLVKMAR